MLTGWVWWLIEWGSCVAALLAVLRAVTQGQQKAQGRVVVLLALAIER